MINPIQYDLIAKAQSFYTSRGYSNMETPWLVGYPAVRATIPPACRSFDTITGSLVGSGEQSFIQLMFDGTLTPGLYQTTTPCFRDEKLLSEVTRPYFMKVELISYMPKNVWIDFQRLLNDATACFIQLSPGSSFDVVQTVEGSDLYCDGVELGSYGNRQLGEHVWVYGTGLAEPRFSITVNQASDQMMLPFDPDCDERYSNAT